MPAQAFRPSAPPIRSNRFLLFGGVATLIVLVVITALIALTQLHQQAEKKAVITSQNLAKSLELTFHGLIDTVNMALWSSSGEITHQILHGNLDAEAITRMLVAQKRYIDHIAYIRATNEKGDVIYGPDLTRPFNVSQRDYFIQLRDNPSLDLYVSKPLVSVFSYKWIWTFARRINKPDGSFGGVIYAPIYVDEIENIFAQMDIGPGSSITLRNADYGLIHRHAPSSTDNFKIGNNNLSDDLSKALEDNPHAGTYTNQVPYTDGAVRIHSYYRNPKYGYTVIVGLSRESALAEWRKQAWTVGGLVTIFVLAMLAFLSMISRSWRRQEKAIASLHTSQTSLQEAQKIAQLGRFTYDLRADQWTSSDILDEIFGIDRDYVRNAQGWANLAVPKSRQEIQAYLAGINEQSMPFERKYRIVRPHDGQERWVHGRGELQLDEHGKPKLIFGTVQDITKSMMHEAELQHVANHDPVTGLPNRRLLADRLSLAVAHARRNGTHLGVCYLDLDEFKPINDRFGHETGDTLLIAITERLTKILREEDTLARIGGDEFILLIGDLAHVEEIHVVLDRVLAAVNAEIQIEGLSDLRLSASIGVTVFPDDNADADTLIRHADYAMYHAKEAGKNRYQLFDPEHNRQVQEHRYNLRRLCEALANDEFVLYYQPKVDLQNGEVVGAEALIRWCHPEQGLLSPGAFLHYIENSQLEVEVGEWVINSALSQIEIWDAIGLDIAVSVNISAKHLLRPDFAERLRLSLERHQNINPSRLELEILETAALSDMDQAVRVLTLCKEYGVKVALDDFGTGYSSLTYFRKLPIDILKIDQSFVRDMLENSEDLELIGNVLQLANVFNRPVIAEGVETMEHGAMLLHLGCPLVQGYGIARPMPAAQMSDWVKEWGNKTPWLNMGSLPQMSQRPDPNKLASVT